MLSVPKIEFKQSFIMGGFLQSKSVYLYNGVDIVYKRLSKTTLPVWNLDITMLKENKQNQLW